MQVLRHLKIKSYRKEKYSQNKQDQKRRQIKTFCKELSVRNLILFLLLIICSYSHVIAIEQPNFIWIMADDLGFGDLGSYGQKVIATPHLDRLAKDGMRFTHFYAGATVCAPSTKCMMTGKASWAYARAWQCRSK